MELFKKSLKEINQNGKPKYFNQFEHNVTKFIIDFYNHLKRSCLGDKKQFTGTLDIVEQSVINEMETEMYSNFGLFESVVSNNENVKDLAMNNDVIAKLIDQDDLEKIVSDNQYRFYSIFCLTLQKPLANLLFSSMTFETERIEVIRDKNKVLSRISSLVELKRFKHKSFQFFETLIKTLITEKPDENVYESFVNHTMVIPIVVDFKTKANKTNDNNDLIYINKNISEKVKKVFDNINLCKRRFDKKLDESSKLEVCKQFNDHSSSFDYKLDSIKTPLLYIPTENYIQTKTSTTIHQNNYTWYPYHNYEFKDLVNSPIFKYLPIRIPLTPATVNMRFTRVSNIRAHIRSIEGSSSSSNQSNVLLDRRQMSYENEVHMCGFILNPKNRLDEIQMQDKAYIKLDNIDDNNIQNILEKVYKTCVKYFIAQFTDRYPIPVAILFEKKYFKSHKRIKQFLSQILSYLKV